MLSPVRQQAENKNILRQYTQKIPSRTVDLTIAMFHSPWYNVRS
jgi:hypothetical protein